MTQLEQGKLLPATRTFEYLPLTKIDDPEFAMRSDMSKENLAELASSIKQIGLLEPIVVTPRGDRYEVVAGHRRTHASELAGLTEVPCHIVHGSDDQTEMMKIHENLMRQDVNPWDEATHYARLITDKKLTPGKIAAMTSRSDSYVRQRLNLLSMDNRLQEAVREGKLKLSVAAELGKITDPAKLGTMIGYAVTQGITGEVAKRWVAENQPTAQPIAGTLPDTGNGYEPTPASEQKVQCFYCLEHLGLYDGTQVVVHDKCAADRMTEAETPAPQP